MYRRTLLRPFAVWLLTIMLLLCCMASALAEGGDDADMTGECRVQTSGKKVSFAALTDENDKTKLTLANGDWFALQWDSPLAAQGLYLAWESMPEEYIVEQRDFDGVTISTATFSGGLPQQYMPVESNCGMVLLLAHGKGVLSDVCLCRAETDLPERVHNWLPPAEKADLMLVAGLPGDELTVFSGVLAAYALEKQLPTALVYLSRGSSAELSAALDALWASGVRTSPIVGDYAPAGSPLLAELEGRQIDEGYSISFIIEQIRRFQPRVLVSHEEGGEDGDATRAEAYRAVRQAAALADRDDMFGASVAEYGLWRVSKLYLHGYGESALDIDGVDYGLVSSDVGEDSGLGDLFENIPETAYVGYVPPEETPAPTAEPTPYAPPTPRPTPTPVPDTVRVTSWAGKAWIALGVLFLIILALVAVLIVRSVREWRKTGVQVWGKKKEEKKEKDEHEHDA